MGAPYNHMFPQPYDLGTPRRRDKTLVTKANSTRLANLSRRRTPSSLVPIEPLLLQQHAQDLSRLLDEAELEREIDMSRAFCQSPRKGGTSSRLHPRSGLDPSESSKESVQLPAIDSARGRGVTDAAAMSDPTPLSPRSKRKGTYHIVLLAETFNQAHPPSLGYCSGIMASILQVDKGMAMEHCGTVHRQPSVVVDHCDSRGEALRRAWLLRDRGLSVRVSLALSPKDPSAKARCERLEDFAQAASGTLRSDLQRWGEKIKVRERHKLGKQARKRCHSDWRERQEATIEFAPENAVEAYFEFEEQVRQGKVIKKAESAEKVKRTWAQIVWERMPEIKAMAAELAAHDPAGKNRVMPGQNKDDKKRSPWDALTDAVLCRQFIPHQNKEACKLVRTFIFGRVGNENARTKIEHNIVYQQACGSREMVAMLWQVWERLDRDGSGKADIIEFRAFAKDHMHRMIKSGIVDSVLKNDGVNLHDFVNRLCDSIERLLLDKKSFFAIEDLAKLIWPAARPADLKTMRVWIREFRAEAANSVLKPPPVLPKEEFDGLRSIFHLIDMDGSGSVDFEELISQGVIHDYQEAKYRRDWDKNGDGSLDMLEFCDMMCPAGFRAHAKSTVGTTAEGRRLILCPILNKWRLDEETAPELLGPDALQE